MSRFSRWQDLVLPLCLVASVLVILVPLPAHVLDVLLAANIAVSVIVLLTTVYVRTPLEFSIFPTLLLATTLFRLVLNVASTRLILTRAGEDGMAAAGGVIKAFGEFVAGDQLVVGLIIFVIIVVIQFVVITKGATRISEVAARFALDGMPGRQMAIDADLSAGVIDENEARRRRLEITQHADFFGAMDGASKFVRGDAIAGIVIIFVNIIGGFVIGVAQEGMSLAESAKVFTMLSIGDGLVTQVPALLVSLAAGLLVTRSTQKTDLPAQFLAQLFSNPRALAVAAGFLAILVLTNLPKVPLLALGAGCGSLALLLSRRNRQALAEQAAQAQAAADAKKPEERIEDYLAIDPMEIEIGAALVKLASPKYGGDLLPRITAVRQSVASDLGIILPKVRVRDNIRLGETYYRVKIAGSVVAHGEVMPGKLLALDAGAATGPISGIETRDPAFQQPAVWIDPGLRDEADLLGYRLVEPSAVLATHLTEIVLRHADELLTRDATKHLIDELKKTSPAVVDELIPSPLKVADVQQVLQLLLREEVPIRQLGLILETMGDLAGKTKDAVLLAEHVRQRLARTISSRYRDAEGRLHVLTLDPSLEDKIASGIDHTERGLVIRTAPQTIERMCDQIHGELPKLTRGGKRPVLLVAPQIRPALRQMAAANLPRLVVLSYGEVSRDTKVEIVGIISET
ncbi:MAG: flagellar biosynthesis protein FlhA [Planctomycetaceae bacterium]|nr:flagellar biosynthesis protein FlhA [Planctomycetaceae bacterium]